MRAVVIMEPGDADVLAIKEAPTPNPSGGDVRVRVRAVGVNRADVLQRRGMYPAPPGVPPDIPGLEFAGEVDARGPQADPVPLGSRVMGLAAGGAYAEYLTLPASHVLPIPSPWSFEEAAAIPEAYLTAHDALTRLAVAAHDWVIVTAVGSGVGTAAVQLIKARGASCIGTSRTPWKLDRAVELGLDVGLPPTPGEFTSAVLAQTGAGAGAGAGADAAIDLVGGAFFPELLRSLAPRGRVIVVGLTGGRSVTVDLGVLLRHRLTLEGTVLRSRSDREKADLVRDFAESVLPLFTAGHLRPVVDRVYDFEEMREAHRYMEDDANFGKIIVRVD